MKNTYTIFFEVSDAYNYVKIKCKPEELVSKLIEEELLETAEEYELVNWLILEDGVKIKG